jgi:raffinose/stachyose/melibiose transport system permease protein
MLLMSAIWSFQGFDFAWMLTEGGPGGSSELLATYIYKQAFMRFNAGYATAIGLTVMSMSGVFVALFVYLRRKGWEI